MRFRGVRLCVWGEYSRGSQLISKLCFALLDRKKLCRSIYHAKCDGWWCRSVFSFPPPVAFFSLSSNSRLRLDKLEWVDRFFRLGPSLPKTKVPVNTCGAALSLSNCCSLTAVGVRRRKLGRKCRSGDGDVDFLARNPSTNWQVTDSWFNQLRLSLLTKKLMNGVGQVRTSYVSMQKMILKQTQHNKYTPTNTPCRARVVETRLWRRSSLLHRLLLSVQRRLCHHHCSPSCHTVIMYSIIFYHPIIHGRSEKSGKDQMPT